MISDWQTLDYLARIKSRPTTYLTMDEQPANFFAAFAEPLQELEDVFRTLYESLSIYNAKGIMLDAFGEMVKEPRLMRGDNDYRDAILLKRSQTSGSGTGEDIMAGVKFMTGGGTVRIVRHAPAAYVAICNGTTIPKDLPKFMKANSVAGVAGYPVFDYGLGGFVLSGLGDTVLNMLGIQPGDSVGAGAQPGTDIGIGINAVVVGTGGTRLASVLEADETNPVNYGSAVAGAAFYGSYDAGR